MALIVNILCPSPCQASGTGPRWRAESPWRADKFKTPARKYGFPYPWIPQDGTKCRCSAVFPGCIHGQDLRSIPTYSFTVMPDVCQEANTQKVHFTLAASGAATAALRVIPRRKDKRNRMLLKNVKGAQSRGQHPHSPSKPARSSVIVEPTFLFQRGGGTSAAATRSAKKREEVDLSGPRGHQRGHENVRAQDGEAGVGRTWAGETVSCRGHRGLLNACLHSL
jgi:hypothetical protein